MKKLVVLACAFAALCVPAQAKKVLDHDDFDNWKRLVVGPVANDGSWASYCSNAQEGDGTLFLVNTKTRKSIEIPRGYNPTFTANSQWAVALIKPLFKDTRKAKIDKKKDFDMPQDSMAVVNLKTGAVERIPRVISYRLGKEGGDWLAYLSSDTALIKESALKDKEAGRPLVLKHLGSDGKKVVNWVRDYIFSKDGSRIALTVKPTEKDSLVKRSLGVLNIPDTSYVVIDYDRRHYGTPVFDEKGSKLAFTVSDDSIKSGTRETRLFLADLTKSMPKSEEILVDRYEHSVPNLSLPHVDDPELQEELMRRRTETMREAGGRFLRLNQYSTPSFSHDGSRLFVGIAPIVAPDDTTLVDFELPSIDIWRWDSPYTPPQENKIVEKLRKTTFPVAVDLNTMKSTLLNNIDLATVTVANRGDGDWVMISDPTECQTSTQWDYIAPKKLYLLNIKTGENRLIEGVPISEGELSPNGKYVSFYGRRDYFVYDLENHKLVNVSKKVPYPIWNEAQDIPIEREQYGVAGWSKDDEAFIVYDKYDLWSLDPKGEKDPVCLTNGEGRKTNRKFRYVKLDPEERFITPGQTMVLDVFDYADKRQGLATLKYGKPAAPVFRTVEEREFSKYKKAKDADVFAFQKANFSVSPDLWISNGYDFAKAWRASDINPQMKEYNWGTAELVKWYAYNGVETEGVLYKPEDFDPSKKYPMMVVFYETGSEDLYHHYEMEPSWSWINYPFYVSRGYLVFQPDVHYAPGIPGESAYNYICSGVEDLCNKYEWIDRDHVGIDGQSWGGYQTAFLVTRTDMFACAGSGAPVSNMTSAFGGIRWGSGDSRQAQYEQGQSRIGRNLWEARDLYIANSPIFYADRVNTPLLIMHNDQDGAVPWYQGIELFMALRRLQKPVWMLQYNGEAHNLIERRNRKDITKRLAGFFDHYLKGEPMPKWMKEGIPATRKGQEFGF